MRLIPNRVTAFIIVGVILSSLSPSVSFAYSYSGYKWGGTSVNIDVSGWPSGWISPLASGMSAWNNAGSSWRFFSGSSSHTFTTGNPGIGYIALTSIYAPFGTIWDVDTVFNTTSYSFATNGSSCCYDVQNTATHELGHWLDLNDLYGAGDTEKTMYGSEALGETKKSTLDIDDINGIKFIYP